MKRILEDHIKHRLIGLVVILALMTIFLPAVIKQSHHHFDDSMNLSLHVPKKPALPHLSMVDKNRMFKEVKVATVAIAPMAHVHANVSKAMPLSGVNAVRVANAPESHPETLLEKSKTLLAHIGPSDRYAIQLASFTKQANAQKLVESLRAKGFEAALQTLNNEHGKLYQVVVGQLKQRHQAIDLQRELVNNTQLNGIIVKTKVS